MVKTKKKLMKTHDYVIAFDEVITNAKNEKEAYKIAQKLIKNKDIQINLIQKLD